MNIKRLTASLLALACVWGASAQKYVSRIESLRKERWWGVYDNVTPCRPLAAPFSAELPDVAARCAAQDGCPVMFVSNSGRYIFTSSPAVVEFDGKDFTIKSDYEKVSVRKEGRTFKEAYVMASLKNLMNLYPRHDPQLYSLPVYMTESELGAIQGEAEVLAYADRILREGYPAGIIIICEGWRDPDGHYIFDRTYYPDPEGMLRQLHARGFKVMLAVSPYMPASGRTYMRYLKSGRLLRKASGRAAVASTPYGYLSILDMGNAENCSRLRSQLDKLVESGVDGFSFSCDLMPGTDKGDFIANWHSLGRDFALCEYVGREESADYQSGDSPRGWEALTATIAKLEQHSQENPDWDSEAFCAEMAGFMQLSSVMPVFRVPFAPWNITKRPYADMVKAAFRFRAENSEYFARLAREADQTSEPMLRNMEYHFNKSGFSDCDTQYLLGRNILLVLPTGSAGKRMVQIPHGVWLDAAGRRYKGPAVISVECDANSMAVFRAAVK